MTVASYATDAEELLVTWLRTQFPVDNSDPIQILLAEALDASETGIDVDDGTRFKIGDIIAVEREMMTVTDVVGNTLTVTRGTNSTAATHADNTPVGVFQSRRYALAQPLQPQAVDNFPGKVTIGAYNIDSNDLLSAWVISNLTGGHGIADHDEGVTDNRYRFGTIYTRYASQWTKPFEITETALGADSTVYFGDVNQAGTDNLIAGVLAAGTYNVYENTTDRGALGDIPNGTGSVDYSGSASQNLFYIPTGAGYTTFNPVGNTVQFNASPNFEYFTLWDEKIIGIDNIGGIYYATTAAATTTFTAYTLGGNALRLDNAFCPPRGLATFINRNGESTVYVIGRSNVWALDADTPRLYKIPDFESKHPDFGRHNAVWRGELFVSSGMDILAFNGEVIRNIGMSRDDGLPFIQQGYVKALYTGQNSLYCMIIGAIQLNGNSTTSIHEWSGFGWHCIWSGTNPNAKSARSMVVSSAGGYNLVWSLTDDGATYTQALPVTFTNPREAIDNSAADFGVTWLTPVANTFYLETGRFDANMKGYRKIANAVEMDVRTCPTNNSIKLYYRIDDDTAWTQMYHTDGAAPSGQTVTTTGHHVFEMGHYDPTGHFVGIDFEVIEFRMEYVDTTTGVTTTPAVTSLVFSFLKLMNPSLAWTASLDLMNSYHDASPQVMLDELTELRTLPNFFSIQHKARTYRARMSGMQDVELGGEEEAATAQISLLEIPKVLGVKGPDH